MPRRTPDPNEGHGLPLPLEEVQAIVTRSVRKACSSIEPAADQVEELVAQIVARLITDSRLASAVAEADDPPVYLATVALNHARKGLAAECKLADLERSIDEASEVTAPVLDEYGVSGAALALLHAALRAARHSAAELDREHDWAAFEDARLREWRSGEPNAKRREVLETYGLSVAEFDRAIAWSKREFVTFLRRQIDLADLPTDDHLRLKNLLAKRGVRL
jgi:hypothetical protein